MTDTAAPCDSEAVAEGVGLDDPVVAELQEPMATPAPPEREVQVPSDCTSVAVAAPPHTVEETQNCATLCVALQYV